MTLQIGDRVTTYLGGAATIADTDGTGRYKSTTGLWWTWDGEALQEVDEPTEERYTARVARLLPELVALPHWVAYKLVPSRKRPGKTDKLPYNPHADDLPDADDLAKSDDSTTWGTFEQAAAFLARHPELNGLGFELGEGPEAKSGFVGVDLDNCIDEAGNMAPWAAAIVDRLESYTEVSPSGKGLRIFCRGELPEGGRKKGDIEMYDCGRFLTVTGREMSR